MKQLAFTNDNIDSSLAPISDKQTNDADQSNEYYGNWKLSLKTNVLFLSSAARSLLGLSQEGNYGLRQLLRLIDLQCFEKAKTWLRMVGSGGVLEPVHLKIYKRNSDVFWVKLTGFYYTNHRQSPGLILGIIQDYTHHVNEERITLSIVNHEIRTPLSVMKLNAQMIQLPGKNQFKASHVDLARNIERHVDGVTKLLEQYLTDSGDSGKFQRLNLSVFDLNNLIRQVLIDVAMIHGQHKFINKCSGQTLVRADKFMIMQVLINYLTNAVKYSPKDSEITVEACINAQHIIVAIIDQGEGIPSGLEKRIFEQFFRTGGQCMKDMASRGLGLYLVKHIIERHKGSVWMKSGAEKGSVFFFSLPLPERKCELD